MKLTGCNMTFRRRIGAWALALLILPAGAYAQTTRSDFDGSGLVDFGDFLLFAQAFGGRDLQFDLDGSGLVDFGDYLLFVVDFVAGGSDDTQKAGQWVRIEAVNSAPIERFDHTLIMDPVRNRLVLFGGKTEDVLGDTWSFDLDSRSWWEVQASIAPAARRGHTAIYDAPRRRMVIFGGESSGFFNDVWAFDLETEVWEKLAVPGNLPVPRYGTSAVFDSLRNRMVVSHGFSSEGRFDDTWAFDLVQSRWTNLTPSSGPKPLKRCLHDAVNDEANDRMLLFGGCSSGFGPCPQGDLWAFDLARHVWTQLQPSGDVPSARGNPAMAYDAAGERVLLFGGASDVAIDDTWSFAVVAQEWQAFSFQEPTPAARWSHDAVIDAARKRLLIFGGTDGAVRFNDMWELNF